MDSATKKKGIGKRIAIGFGVVIAVVLLVIGIYVATGPHTAVEAVLKSPALAGPQANYEADGEISIKVGASGFSLPATKIPFVARVVGNSYRIDFFDDSEQEGDPVYSLYFSYDGKKFAHREEGNPIGLLDLTTGAVALAGANSDVGENLGLEDVSVSNLEALEIAKFASQAGYSKDGTGSDVTISGSAVSELLGKMTPQNKESIGGVLGEALESTSLVVTYDVDGNPVKMTLDGAEATMEVDMGLPNKVNVNVKVNADASFSRIGQVSADEVAFPY